MKIESLEGIILSETDYSESSKILNVLTKERGLIGIMSKGCRSMKSKLRGISRKMIHATFHIYYKEKGLSTLISADLISSFPKTITDLEKFSYASFILDIVYQVLKQNDSEDIFPLLTATLQKLEEGYDPLVITNIFELKLLTFLGVSPNLDSCACCGSKKDIVSLSSTSGGYVCRNCQQNEPPTTEKTIKMIRLYYYVDIEKITRLSVSPEVTKEINDFLEDYYDRYTGLYTNSKDFIKKVNSLKQLTEKVS